MTTEMLRVPDGATAPLPVMITNKIKGAVLGTVEAPDLIIMAKTKDPERITAPDLVIKKRARPGHSSSKYSDRHQHHHHHRHRASGSGRHY